MEYFKKTLAIFLFLGAVLQTQAQQCQPIFQLASYEEPFSEYSAILLDGSPLFDKNNPNRPLQLSPEATGTLSFFTLNSSVYWQIPKQSIGFKLAIKDAKTNTLWMYSEKPLYEVDLSDLLLKCEEGDRLIFMTVDQKYRLPQNEVMLGDGC